MNDEDPRITNYRPEPEDRDNNDWDGPDTCPNCGRTVDHSNPMISNMRCRECQSVQSLAGEIFLFDNQNPITVILGWLFGK